ncbi:U-box domain-containing protein 43 [Linum grandiflorum]
MALENLSHETKNLTRLPDVPAPKFCSSIFPCFSRQPVITGLCRLHRGTCSLNETFCLLEGQGVEKLVALLDHNNEMVVEAALAAVCTLLEDGVDVEQGMRVLLYDAEGIRPILDVLIERRTENLQRRGVWAVERLLRFDDIANEVSGAANLTSRIYIMAIVIKLVWGMMMMVMMIMGCSSNYDSSRIQLANDLGDTVKVHCQSKGTKIKAHEIEPGSVLSWNFGDTIFCNTLFWCDLAVLDKHLHFDIYKCDRKSNYPTSWRIYRLGVYSTNFRDLSYPWEY